jgi:hypothetical protein
MGRQVEALKKSGHLAEAAARIGACALLAVLPLLAGLLALPKLPFSWAKVSARSKQIGSDPQALDQIPQHLRTKDLCQLAVQANWRAIEEVPEDKDFYSLLCQLSVESEGFTLEELP